MHAQQRIRIYVYVCMDIFIYPILYRKFFSPNFVAHFLLPLLIPKFNCMSLINCHIIMLGPSLTYTHMIRYIIVLYFTE